MSYCDDRLTVNMGFKNSCPWELTCFLQIFREQKLKEIESKWRIATEKAQNTKPKIHFVDTGKLHNILGKDKPHQVCLSVRCEKLYVSSVLTAYFHTGRCS
jgi:predicted AAA+ superfamily ATPase